MKITPEIERLTMNSKVFITFRSGKVIETFVVGYGVDYTGTIKTLEVDPDYGPWDDWWQTHTPQKTIPVWNIKAITEA